MAQQYGYPPQGQQPYPPQGQQPYPPQQGGPAGSYPVQQGGAGGFYPDQQQTYGYPAPQQMQQQQQQQAYQMQQMPAAVSRNRTLFPTGCYIADRPSPPTDCSCPPCYCYRKPFWFVDGASVLNKRGGEYTPGPAAWVTPKCNCTQGFDMAGENGGPANVLGQQLSFDARECCGVASCCEPEVHVIEDGKNIGHVIQANPCLRGQACECNEVELAIAVDQEGKQRFARKEKVCCPEWSHLEQSDCFGYWQWAYPVVSRLAPSSSPIAKIVVRRHSCGGCYPQYVGVRDIAAGISEDDQKLLVAMAICRLWRADKDQKDENGGGGDY